MNSNRNLMAYDEGYKRALLDIAEWLRKAESGFKGMRINNVKSAASTIVFLRENYSYLMQYGAEFGIIFHKDKKKLSFSVDEETICKGGNKMNIQEATKKSLETGAMIKRKGWESDQTSIKPTNTPEGCVCFCNQKSPCKGWQPLAEDLISDDWVVI